MDDFPRSFVFELQTHFRCWCEPIAIPQGCAKTPRNNKRTGKYLRKIKRRNAQRKQKVSWGEEEESWGFWVKGRDFDGNSFCCIRGPRAEEMVRTPRMCARTPRK